MLVNVYGWASDQPTDRETYERTSDQPTDRETLREKLRSHKVCVVDLHVWVFTGEQRIPGESEGRPGERETRRESDNRKERERETRRERLHFLHAL